MTQLYIFLTFVVTGLVFGKINESRHYRSIKEREKETTDKPVITFGNKYFSEKQVKTSELVTANVVISIDYFKKTISSIITLVGGTLYTYESLLDRARREALLRLKESNTDADIIINTRVETSSIFKGNKGNIGSVEVVVYGTALIYKDA